ncbi:DUF7782 domain-containing protein [Gordonia soli]|uniref:Uncharacterized protein n=1 Tax=Gordonia soli NBRC 108243 TaxID=1223545 RepID=M0QKZ7_9ACTN|nr:methyltransferase [Gordonia soli]GAC69114.1 hypothetical protein GS4_20_01800 [Gordonia soli NBRC 108243]
MADVERAGSQSTGATRRLPLTDGDVVDALGVDLRAAGFTSDGVGAVLGDEANEALGRGVWWPAIHATEHVDAERRSLAVLIRLFLLGSDEPEEVVVQAFPGVGLDALRREGVLEIVGDADGMGDGQVSVRAILDIRPHADDQRDYLVISDQDAALRPGPVHHDHVLGIGGASVSLARAVIRDPVGRALDLGTGCGIQALHLSGHCDTVVATDTNDRALALAAATARLNGLEWDLRPGSLFEPVAGERFDLIVSNPPFVVGAGEQDYIYRDSGMAGDTICAALVAGLADHLNPGGTAQILANWVVRDPEDWSARPREWLADTGLDAWVVQRELADPVSYVSLWLSDAGETAEQSAARGGRWLQWFSDQGIVGIGMGVITVRLPEVAGSRGPDQVFEEILAAGEEVTGHEAAAFLRRRAYLRDTSDAELLAARLSTAPVMLTAQSLPGPEGWQEIASSVNRPGGPGATVAVDEVSRALFAGCRGEVPLAMLIDLLAGFHGVDSDALAEAALPVVREAITRGILYQAE